MQSWSDKRVQALHDTEVNPPLDIRKRSEEWEEGPYKKHPLVT